MRWQDGRRSSNVDDRRSRGGARGAMKLGGAGGLIVIVIAVGMALMGKDPSALLEATGALGGNQGQSQPTPTSPESDAMADFVSVVLADTEDVWRELFRSQNVQQGQPYTEPTLVLFRGSVASACGMNTSAVGPFYCPGDRQVYIDLSFFDDLDQRFGAPGDFAQAYVVAHEVGHHIQKLMGVSDRVHRMRRQVSESEGNALSVRQELQADCLAGVWAHHANRRRQLLEPGDLEEGLRAAAAIGDDTLQRRAGGAVSPESWTHGSSEQRVRWFRRGFSSGSVAQCDTFSTNQL